jgi:hypothetical protein
MYKKIKNFKEGEYVLICFACLHWFRLVELIVLDSLKKFNSLCFVSFPYFRSPNPNKSEVESARQCNPRQGFHWAADIFCHHPVSQDDALTGVKGRDFKQKISRMVNVL